MQFAGRGRDWGGVALGDGEPAGGASRVEVTKGGGAGVRVCTEIQEVRRLRQRVRKIFRILIPKLSIAGRAKNFDIVYSFSQRTFFALLRVIHK